MTLHNISKFIYEDGALENSGGVEPTTTSEEAQSVHPSVPESFISADELRSFGFESKESLTSYLQQQKEANRPDTEKQKEVELEKANFIKYSTENDTLNLDEYNEYESIKAKDAKSLVFDKFLKEFAEDNDDIEPSEIEEEARLAFEAEYKLNSGNDKTKARGEARLIKEAGELKNPFQTKYNTAKEAYDQYKMVSKKFPDYNKFMDEVIAENTPDTFTVKVKDGENEIPVDIELTKEQRTEIEKLFKTPKQFTQYIKGDKVDEFKSIISRKINGYIKANNFDKAVAKGFETGVGIGTKKGSNIGAENPYGLYGGKGQNSQGGVVISLEESNAKIAQARARVAR